ncbi:HupE/UreJ family protein [Marinobacter sp. HL-58]|uniref:HupE/UreJ family protein n=1 Tax=Marinobacter sp. HL-58 TaxID=1479237 RepID=UPI00068C026F|nr:HupE/UreJ family protein [Marinobacter sp. HL-58]KPQ01535.1 MAG: Ni2+ uptake transporter UreJ [Marinobacter sp. HL-58]
MKYQFLSLLVLFFPMASHGHHPMGGEVPETAIQGLLSGLGHPIIELDHFLFVVGFACLLAFCSRQIITHTGLFLALTIVGTLGHLALPDLPFIETGIFLTIVIVGGFLLAQRLDSARLYWFLAPVAGLLHGYGYGGAVVGAENTAVFAYLIGFTMIQAVLMLSLVYLVRRLARNCPEGKFALYRSINGAMLIGFAFFV